MKTKKNFLKKLTAGILGFVMTLGVGAAGYAGATSETRASTTFSINSSDVVNNSGYKEYAATVGDRGWIITFGGNNKSVGTNSSNRSKCNLSSKSKYAVSPVTTSDVASAFVSTTSISNISGISYTINGGSNQTNTNVYVIYSSDGNTFSQISLTSGTQGSAISSGTSYSFNNCSGYFGLLFKATNSSGNWRIDEVELTFTQESSTTKTLSSIAVSSNHRTFTVGDTFIKETVTATYSDSSTADVTNSATFSSPDMSTAGTKTISVSYTEGGTTKTATYGITVSAGGGGEDDDYTTEYIGDLTFDLSANPGGWPTANDTTVTDYPYTIDGEGTFKFGLKNVKCNSGYLMLTQPAVLGLPAFTNSKLTKVVAKNSGSCSTSVNVGISSSSSQASYISGGAAQTWSSTSSTYTYTLSETAVNTVYYLYVTSKNAQITELTLTYASGITHTVGTISVDKDVYVGKTATCSAECDQDDGITWSVENGTGSATINASTGVITGVTAGTVTVTATCDGGGSSTKTVTIKADVKTLLSISVSGAKNEFTLGDSFATTGLVVEGTYSHTDGTGNTTETISSGITTTPSAGTKLTSQGSQTVTVSAGGKSTTYSITVNYAAVTGITAATEEIDMGPGDVYTFTATVAPENANPNYTISASSDVLEEDVDYMFDSSTGEVLIADEPEAGDLVLTFTATGNTAKTCTTTIHVQAKPVPQVVGFNASGTPTKAKQYRNATFSLDLSGITITGTFDDESTQTFTSDQFSWNTTGEHPIGTYLLNEELTVTVASITLEDDGLGSIAFVNGCDMTNKEYWVGDSWNFAGLAIEGKYKSGGDFTLDTSKVSFTTSSTTSAASDSMSIVVTAHYQGFSGTEPTKTITGIKVKAVTMTSLTVSYTGGQPVLGTDFTFVGTITANYSNGDSRTIDDLSDVTIGSVNKFTLDEQTITVTHKTTGVTGDFNVQYKAKEIETEVSWTRCTAATDLIAGGTFIIGYEATAKSGVLIPMMNSGSATTGKAGYMYSGGSDGGSDTITMSSVTATEDYEVVIGESSAVEGDIYIKIGDNYLGNTNTKNNCKLFEDESENTAFHVTVGDNDVFTLDITANKDASDNYKYLQYNSTSPRFAVYKSGQKNLVIYKKVETPIGQPSVIKIDASLKAGKTFSEGDSISASDFDVSALYDTGVTGDVTATSVAPTKLGPGDNAITVNYNSFSDTVVVSAAEIAHLDYIAVVDGTGQRSFERLDDFDSSTLEVMAYYSNTDKTKFPDHKVTNFTVDSTEVDMDETGTYTVGVSYTENGVTKSTSYDITVSPKTSTYVTIEGDGIQGSSGVYTLTSPVQNTVDLTIDFDGDEELSVSTESSFLSYVNGQLIINSDTKTSETGSITFSAGDVSATLTVTVTAAETIQLISDAHVAGFIGEDLNVEIALGNVESATWTLPSGSDGFTVKTTSKDNTGFVGTISVSEECTNKEAVFSVITGKGETLSVTVYVSAQFDAIKSISATCSKSYVAGQDTFSPSDLTVTYERLSGATGTLTSSEFTVAGAPIGKLARTSYNLTITSNEGSKTCNCTISADMPSGLNVVTAHTEEIPGQTTVSWSLLSNKSQLDANEKIYLYESSKGYVTGANGSDATVSSNASQRIEFSVEIVDSNAGTFKLKSTSGSTSGDYISNIADNKFNIAASQSQAAVFQIDNNTEGLIYYTDSKSATRMLAVNGNYLRCYKTGNSNYTYFSAYISKTTTGQPTTKITYTNHESMSGTMFDFINRWGGTELTAGNWGDIFGSDEYKALTATDKEWFAAGVVSGTDATAGYLESCELFADFITKYDEVLATNDGLTNYLNRLPVEAYTITIDYNHDGQTSTVKALAGEYNLPEAPTYEGYVFQGWLVNGEIKAAGSPITVSGDMTITAQWVQGITFSSEFGFKFTGLDITRFQLIFNGTCPDDAESYGFLYTKSDIDLTKLTATDIQNGVTGVGVTSGTQQAVFGTSNGNTELTVVFYYIDGDGQVHYSEVIKTSFDEMAQKYDLNQITDPYARLCLEYYLANFAE